MKDYSLIKYVSKKMGFKPVKYGGMLKCCTWFKNAIIKYSVSFKNKQSSSIICELDLVYELYGQQFGDYREFLKKFSSKYTSFSIVDLEEKIFLSANFLNDKKQHTVSMALSFLSALTACLNEFLNQDEKVFSEEDWRNCHRMYLQKNKTISSAGILGSITIFILSIVAMFYGSESQTVFLIILAFIGMFLGLPVGIIGTPLFAFRYVFFKNSLKKSLREKR